MSILRLIDALKFEASRNPTLPEGLIWEVVGRLARAERSAAYSKHSNGGGGGI
jgi:hypothetical protein